MSDTPHHLSKKRSPVLKRVLPMEITLDLISRVPLHRQLTDSLRRAIIAGVLPRNSRIPSIRDLANQLNVSRATVLKCFNELADQGYIVTTTGFGTNVCPHLPGYLNKSDDNQLDFTPASQTAIESIFSDYANRLIALGSCLEPASAELLNSGEPLIAVAPVNYWRTLLERHHYKFDTEGLSDQAAVQLHLKTAYAGYLARSRAIRCSADQVFAFTARELRQDLICRLLLEPGDIVAVENPGYPGARNRFALYGAKVQPIPVDHQGLDVDFLCRLTEPVRIVYVTPSHHEPTGVVMTMARRHKLLQWALHTGAFIIEDDYDSEFRYDCRPIPSLASLDDTDSVIHLSCLWKVLSPVSKIGFLVLPHSLLAVFRASKDLIEREMPLIDQLVLADFISEGYLEKHIRKNRFLYAGQRKALVEALKKHFGNLVTITPESAGMDLFVHFNFGLQNSLLMQLAQKSELKMIDAKPYYLADAPDGEFIIPFSLLTEEQITSSLEHFAQLIRLYQSKDIDPEIQNIPEFAPSSTCHKDPTPVLPNLIQAKTTFSSST